MKQRTTIKIDDKEITLKELTVKDILAFQDRLSSDDSSGDGILDLLGNLLPKITQDVTVEDLKDMSPSEIEKLVDGFREVNSALFRGISWTGFGESMADFRQAVMRDLVAGLFSPDENSPETPA